MTRNDMLSSARTALAVAALIGGGAASQAQAAGDYTQTDAAGTSKAVLNFRTCAKPVYPHEELKAGHAGTVKLGFLVRSDGSVGETKVLASTGYPALDEEARSALARCQFSPATRAGQAIDTWTEVQYVWSTK
jgi:TonB family protein